MNRSKKEKLGSATSGRKPYIFCAQPIVFQLVISNNETSNNFQGSESGEEECTTNPVEAHQQAYVSLQKGNRADYFQNNNNEGLTESVKLKMLEKGKDDEDRHFLLPLVLELRNVPSLHEHDIKTKILNIVKRFKHDT